jgi:hypothetical protein
MSAANAFTATIHCSAPAAAAVLKPKRRAKKSATAATIQRQSSHERAETPRPIAQSAIAAKIATGYS